MTSSLRSFGSSEESIQSASQESGFGSTTCSSSCSSGTQSQKKIQSDDKIKKIDSTWKFGVKRNAQSIRSGLTGLKKTFSTNPSQPLNTTSKVTLHQPTTLGSLKVVSNEDMKKLSEQQHERINLEKALNHLENAEKNIKSRDNSLQKAAIAEEEARKAGDEAKKIQLRINERKQIIDQDKKQLESHKLTRESNLQMREGLVKEKAEHDRLVARNQEIDKRNQEIDKRNQELDRMKQEKLRRIAELQAKINKKNS